jgi:hypothetical protein
MAFGAILTVNSCTKDTELSENDNGLQLREDRNQVHYFEPNDTVKPIIVGAKITQNPFSVENMTRAWNILYPDCKVTSLNPTDKYIKLKPNSAEQVYELKKDISLTLFEFPLDYKVIEMGDYYDDPTAGEFQNFYGIIGSEQSMPANIDREVLSELYLDDSDPLLEAVAMINDGYPLDVISDYIGPINRTDIDDCASIVIPPIIDCDPPCVPMLRIRDDVPPVNGKPQMEWYCDCSGGDPGSGGGGGGTGPYTTNGCGCKVFTDQLKPGGCVTVWDENLGRNVGVRNAKIIVKNTSGYNYDYPWTWVRTTNTDDNGCWKIDRRCSKKNNIHVWVEFNNEKALIRAPHYDPQRHLIPVADYVGEIDGPVYNDIHVNYSVWTQGNTQTQRYWCAANTINCIAEMHDNCNTNGMNIPPHLDIYIGYGTGGAAPMSKHGGPTQVAIEFSEAITGGPALGLFTMSQMPDIYLGRDRHIERYKFLNFHEFAHASHFSLVGLFWYNTFVNYEVGQILSNPDQDPYGDGTAQNAGYCAVAESWANHIGNSFAGVEPSDMDNIYMENGFIPNGLHWDLFDKINDDEVFFVNDVVGGFTNEKIFDVLYSKSINELKLKLWNEHGSDTGIIGSQADYNDLFLSYGY